MTGSSPAARVVPLHELRRSDTARAGGEGAHLGDLLAAGFPVPAGSVVLTSAYHDVVTASDTGERLARLVRARGPQASEDAHRLVTSAPVPADLRAALVRAWHDLGAPPVAVRSSATSEDTAAASSAGQQDTFLDVRTEAGLVESVRACWASLWTARDDDGEDGDGGAATGAGHSRALRPAVVGGAAALVVALAVRRVRRG